MEELRKFKGLNGGTVVEMGSRDGHDANAMAIMFNAGRIITIEANPESFNDIQNYYPNFENYNIAISNRSGELDFCKVNRDQSEGIRGASSLLNRNDDLLVGISSIIKVPTVTMDEFVSLHNIDAIEVMKVDVEGATYEALSGFSKIRMTRILHIESEHYEFWEGQHLYEDTAALMTGYGYTQVYFKPVFTAQSDSIWLRNE